jgi:hypothetical protein
MVNIRLNAKGELSYFEAVPPQRGDFKPSSQVGNWKALFAATGLDQTRFTPVTPQWLPLVSFDSRAAWSGSYSDIPDVPLRVEAASWQGRPVYFQVIGPWTRPDADRLQRLPSAQLSTPQRVSVWLQVGLSAVLSLFAAFLAWRNYRSGRSDKAGAARLAAFRLSCSMVEWLLSAHHIPTYLELFQLYWGIGAG